MAQHPPFLRGGNLKQSLGTTFNELLARAPAASLEALRAAVDRGALERGLYYEDDHGGRRPTPVLLRPRVLGGNQRAYLHGLCRQLERAWVRLFGLWREHRTVRAVMPLTEAEERWIHDLGGQADEVLFGRFDASTDFGSKDWVQSTQLFEYNPIGAGGTHLAPTTDALILEHLVPLLRRHAPTLLVEANDDPRRVLVEILADHARALRLHSFNIALCQFKDLVGGVTEFPHLEEYLRRMGIAAWHIDPRELEVRGDDLVYGDVRIDLVYRDHEILALAEYEAAGEPLGGIKHAIRTGRAVSSLAGELDHKSAFEVFTSPELRSWFGAGERRLFRRHVPWTRLVADRVTTDAEDREIELLPYLRREREHMVLKPNRSFGGEGIRIGRDLTEAQWDSAIEEALSAPSTWVAQGYRPVAEKDFPTIDDRGTMHLGEYYTVLGLFASTQRLGILGRASMKKVVNVAQQGGLCSVLRLI